MQDGHGLPANNGLRAGEQTEQMSASEKSSYRSGILIMLVLCLGMVVGTLLLLAIKVSPHNPVWSRPNARFLLLFVLFNDAVFLIIPCVVLFRLFRRKRKYGSYLPTGEELKKYRARRKKPQPLWKKILSAAFELFGAIGFIIDAMHKSHRGGWDWVIASFLGLCAAITVLAIIGPLLGLGKLGRREGFACPDCGAAPPIGKKWKCDQCGKGFDTFLSRAVCPHCGTQYPATMCGSCHAMHPMNDWIYAHVARNSGAAGGPDLNAGNRWPTSRI